MNWHFDWRGLALSNLPICHSLLPKRANSPNQALQRIWAAVLVFPRKVFSARPSRLNFVVPRHWRPRRGAVWHVLAFHGTSSTNNVVLAFAVTKNRPSAVKVKLFTRLPACGPTGGIAQRRSSLPV